jgi:hypothetical protein
MLMLQRNMLPLFGWGGTRTRRNVSTFTSEVDALHFRIQWFSECHSIRSAAVQMELNSVKCRLFRRRLGTSRLYNDNVMLCLLPKESTVWITRGEPEVCFRWHIHVWCKLTIQLFEKWHASNNDHRLSLLLLAVNLHINPYPASVENRVSS